jgi:hypothetical protein
MSGTPTPGFSVFSKPPLSLELITSSLEFRILRHQYPNSVIQKILDFDLILPHLLDHFRL